MSLATQGAERAKFGYLLQLAQEQIKALETDDFYGFDRIMASKRTLIAGLRDARGMVAADPSLANVIAQIQECDKAAQKLLFRKVGRIMRTMSEIQQYKKARRAYVGPPGSGPRLLPPETPSFLDQNL